MISMQTITNSAQAAAYHEKSFSSDGMSKSDNYYINEQSQGVWEGKGAELLELDGKQVTKEDFVNTLDGKLKNPETGEVQDLSDNSKGEQRRLGYDFTIAPSKSVSIAALVGEDDRVIEAHLEANKKAMQWLEKHASVIRVSENGERQVKLAGNLVYASIMHETNRNNEPQLHNHNVIAAAVYDKDSETWRSLTNDQLLALRTSADKVYKSQLAVGLQKAGYELNFDKNGFDFEIAGFSREHIELYSTRSADIKKQLEAIGVSRDQADFFERQNATLLSRDAKNELPRESLQRVWGGMAQEAGLDVKSIVEQSKSRENSLDWKNNYLEERALRSVAWATTQLSEREQTFSRPELEVAALKYGPISIEAIGSAVDKHIENETLVSKGLAANGASLLTTPRAIENEISLAKHIQSGFNKGSVVLENQQEFDSYLQAFEIRKSKEIGTEFRLSDEQVNAARNLLMHRDTYQGVQGDAGTGKTAALEFVKEVAEDKGWIVRGVATTASASKELEKSTGMRSNTVASFLIEQENAIALTTKELEDLRKDYLSNENTRQGGFKKIELSTLTVRNQDGQNITSNYVFDNEKGQVFKAPESLKNSVGLFMLKISEQADMKLEQQPSGNTLMDRIKGNALMSVSSVTSKVGQELMTYENVGTVEAIEAKNKLILKRGEVGLESKPEIKEKESQLKNLISTGNRDGSRTLLIMDESSLTGIEDTLKIANLVDRFNARAIFQGDVKQHASVPAGKAFAQARESGMNVSEIKETRRFNNATEQTQEAVKLLNAGLIQQAISKLDYIEVDQRDLHKSVAQRYLDNLTDLRDKQKPNGIVGVVTVTNEDRKEINKEVHAILQKNGLLGSDVFNKPHLDNLNLTGAETRSVRHLVENRADRLEFRKSYSEIGIKEGDVAEILSFDASKNRLTIRNSQGREVSFNPRKQDFFTAFKIEEREYSSGDRVESRSIIKFKDKNIEQITTGTKGVIKSIDKDGAIVILDDKQKREVKLTNTQLAKFDLAYARTTFKEQGATTDREIIAISRKGANIFNDKASYVAATRARGNTEIVTSDYKTMLRNASKKVEKTTSIDVKNNPELAKSTTLKIERPAEKSQVQTPKFELAF